MRCHSVFRHSSANFMTDIPKAIGGYGEMPPPTALLAATLASCMLSMLAFTGTRKGFRTEGISIQAACIEEKSGITAFDLHVSVPFSTDTRVRAMMENTVASCPVANALHPSIQKTLLGHSRKVVLFSRFFISITQF